MNMWCIVNYSDRDACLQRSDNCRHVAVQRQTHCSYSEHFATRPAGTDV